MPIDVDEATATCWELAGGAVELPDCDCGRRGGRVKAPVLTKAGAVADRTVPPIVGAVEVEVGVGVDVDVVIAVADAPPSF